MNFGFWNFYEFYNKNRMFTEADSQVGDELSHPTMVLARELRQRGHEVATLEMQPLEWFDKIFFIDYPDFPPKYNRYFKELRRRRHPEVHLMASEPPIARPANHDPKRHGPFKTVMVWRKDLCQLDPQKYRFYRIPNKLRLGVFSRVPFAQRKLSVMVNSFMWSEAPGELFSERVKAVRWFEQNAPGDFDLFGTAWDKPLLTGRLSAFNLLLRFAYRRVPLLGRVKVNRFPSFRGKVQSKHETLHQYRFCLSYENSATPDYVSEKIFDCLFAGCVPVYAGAPNVTDYLPKETFIDLRNFSGYADLHRYLTGMSEQEYQGYLGAIDAFIHGPGIRPFTSEGFAEMFVSNYAAG